MEDTNETGKIRETFNKHLQRIQVIYWALFGGILVITLVAYSLRQQPLTTFPTASSVYIYLVPTAAVAGYFTGNLIFKRLMASLEAFQEVSLKMSRYQTASLLQFTCLEAPTLLALFAYMEEGYLFYAVIAISLILYFLKLRPSREKLLKMIPLNTTEKQVLAKPGKSRV